MRLDESAVPTLQVLSGTDLKKYPEMRWATAIDWSKIPQFLSGEWPKPRPECHFLGENVEADREWYRAAVSGKYVVFDVETVQFENKDYGGRVFQVGLYSPSGSPAIWDIDKYPDFEQSFVKIWRKIVQTKKVIAHNASFDVARIHENFGINVSEYSDLDDTILMHHLLWPELSHRLEFLESVYSVHKKAKHLGVGNYDYLIGDVVSTSEVYEGLLEEFESDPQSWELYITTLKPLLPVLIEFMQEGWPVDQDFVVACLSWMPQWMKYAQDIASAYCGFPVMLKSGPQMRALLMQVEDIFSSSKKMQGFATPKVLTPKGQVSLGKETLTALRSAFLAVDFREVLTPDTIQKRLEQGAHPLLEAAAMKESVRVNMTNYVTPALLPLEEENGEFYYTGQLHSGQGAPREY